MTRSYPLTDELKSEIQDGAEVGFPGLWEIVRESRAAAIAKLKAQLAFLESLDYVEYFVEVGVSIPEEVCATSLAQVFKYLPSSSRPREGAFAQHAGIFGKPWAIRLNYANWETHISLDWKVRRC